MTPNSHAADIRDPSDIAPRSRSLLAEYGKCECFCSEGPGKGLGIVCVFVFVGHTTKALFAHPSSQFGRSDGAMRIADSPLPSAAIASDQRGQRALQECWRSAQRWTTSLSKTITSELSGKGGFEHRGVVKPPVFLCRHLALLPGCHVCRRQATRNSDLLYTYSAEAL